VQDEKATGISNEPLANRFASTALHDRPGWGVPSLNPLRGALNSGTSKA
jgi:hypothetical protein